MGSERVAIKRDELRSSSSFLLLTSYFPCTPFARISRLAHSKKKRLASRAKFAPARLPRNHFSY